jgi:hypothetical protein
VRAAPGGGGDVLGAARAVGADVLDRVAVVAEDLAGRPVHDEVGAVDGAVEREVAVERVAGGVRPRVISDLLAVLCNKSVLWYSLFLEVYAHQGRGPGLLAVGVADEVGRRLAVASRPVRASREERKTVIMRDQTAGDFAGDRNRAAHGGKALRHVDLLDVDRARGRARIRDVGVSVARGGGEGRARVVRPVVVARDGVGECAGGRDRAWEGREVGGREGAGAGQGGCDRERGEDPGEGEHHGMLQKKESGFNEWTGRELKRCAAKTRGERRDGTSNPRKREEEEDV